MTKPRVDIAPVPRTQAPPVLVAQLMLAAALALFLALTLSWLRGATQEFDDWTLIAMRDAVDLSRPLGPGWLMDVMRGFTALGTAMTLTVIVLLGAGWFRYRKDRRSMGLLALTAAGGLLLNLAVKIAINRPRPTVVPMLSEADAWSFPSGHAMMTLAIFLTLAVLIGRGAKSERRRVFLIATALTISAVVGFSRLYLGVHYPSDVAAGWMLGLSWTCICWLLDARLRRRPGNPIR